MPRLNKAARRNIGYPDWADNQRSEDPFSVRVKPLSSDEFSAFTAAISELQGRASATAGDFAKVLGSCIEGPFTREPLFVDDAFVPQGDLLAFIEATGAANESTQLRGNLIAELVFYVAGTVGLNRRQAGESERRPGGGGTSPTSSTPSAG